MSKRKVSRGYTSRIGQLRVSESSDGKAVEEIRRRIKEHNEKHYPCRPDQWLKLVRLVRVDRPAQKEITTNIPVP